MCRLVGWVADRPVSLREVLGEAGLQRFVDLSRYHGHGWGMAHRDLSTNSPTVIRSTLAARDDPGFAGAADITSYAALAHLRWATPGFGLSIDDTHPFAADGWAMIHNGAISPSAAVGGLLGPTTARRATGSTDSENMFLALLDELEIDGVLAPGASLDDVVAALARAYEIVSDRGVAAGLVASSLNSMLLGPEGVYAVNWADVTRVPPLMVEAAKDDPDAAPYYDLLHRELDGVHVVASSGFVSDPLGWEPIGPVSVLGIEKPGTFAAAPIRPQHPLCPIP